MDAPEFVLTRSFTPIGTTFEMESFLSASSDAGTYGKLRLIQFNADADASALTPTQMIGQINGDDAFSRNRTLLGQQGSSIVPGPLQIIPAGDTVVYVQPQFVQGDSSDSRPVLTYVTVSISGQTVCAPSLDEAVDQLVQGVEGCSPFASVGTAPVSDNADATTDKTPDAKEPTANNGDDITKLSDKELVNALAKARSDYESAQNPLNLGNLQKASDSMAKYIDELSRRSS